MRSASQLPPGRHGLTRDEVRASQRGRMLEAMARAVAERGYASATVSDVVRGAGVSRETFYQHFAGKEDCFLAAFDFAAAGLMERMIATLGPSASGARPVENLEATLGAYLETLAAEPVLARTFLIEVYAAGPDALKRRADVLQRFVELVMEVTGGRRFACEFLVSAVSSMVTMRLATGDHAAIPQLREPILEIAREIL